jgi:hypothetical protein
MSLRPLSPQRISPEGGGRLSPGSPLSTMKGGLPVMSETHSAYRAYKIEPRKGGRSAGNKTGSTALWLHEGSNEYHTENRDKFIAHPVPPPAARPVPKYEASKLPLHSDTTYRNSYAGTTAPRRDIHRPKQQTAHMCVFGRHGGLSGVMAG